MTYTSSLPLNEKSVTWTTLNATKKVIDLVTGHPEESLKKFMSVHWLQCKEMMISERMYLLLYN
jgi:hypothetical protein